MKKVKNKCLKTAINHVITLISVLLLTSCALENEIDINLHTMKNAPIGIILVPDDTQVSGYRNLGIVFQKNANIFIGSARGTQDISFTLSEIILDPIPIMTPIKNPDDFDVIVEFANTLPAQEGSCTTPKLWNDNGRKKVMGKDKSFKIQGGRGNSGRKYLHENGDCYLYTLTVRPKKTGSADIIIDPQMIIKR